MYLKPLFCCRKHALNCHRMKPALFNVLCEIKEKTGTSMLILINSVVVSQWKKTLCGLFYHQRIIFYSENKPMLDIQSQHNSAYKFHWHVRHVFPPVAPKSARFNSFTIGTVDNYLEPFLSIMVSKYEWAFCGIIESIEQNCHQHVDVSPCELTVKSAEHVSFYSVLCLSIKAVVREHVSRIIARREIT